MDSTSARMWASAFEARYFSVAFDGRFPDCRFVCRPESHDFNVTVSGPPPASGQEAVYLYPVDAAAILRYCPSVAAVDEEQEERFPVTTGSALCARRLPLRWKAVSIAKREEHQRFQLADNLFAPQGQGHPIEVQFLLEMRTTRLQFRLRLWLIVSPFKGYLSST
jgi:hypothetical protein